MVKEVRSPHSLTRDQYHPQRAVSPGSRSSPSNARSDGGHIAGHVGKGGGLASVRRDAVSGASQDGFAPSARPVVGGQRDPCDPRE
jgi:hypothetical protein